MDIPHRSTLIALAAILAFALSGSAALAAQPDDSNGQSAAKNDQSTGQTTKQSGKDANDAQASADDESDQQNDSEGGPFIEKQKSSQVLSSSLIGMAIQNEPGNTGQQIGKINDLVMNKEHKLVGIIVGVGGFVGIGEKNVGIPWSEVENLDPKQGVAVVHLTQDQLEDAPTFQSKSDQRAKRKAREQKSQTQGQQ